MSFLLNQCLVLNVNAIPEAEPELLLIKDDGTAATEESEEVDPVVLAEKATVIQSKARGMLVRKQTKNRERLELNCRRSRAGHTISKNKFSSNTIEQNIRSIKQTLSFNEGVWNRCKTSMRGEEGTKETKFIRTGFIKVRVATEMDTVAFSTKAELAEKTFDTKSLVEMPAELTGIFEVKYDDCLFLDYGNLLERAQLLHEDVLGPYLVTLREHLESVKSSLNEIDRWLEEPSIHLQFLTKTFDVDRPLDIPDDKSLRLQTPQEILRAISVSYDYQIRGSFDITKEDERKVLKDLLEFVSN